MRTTHLTALATVTLTTVCACSSPSPSPSQTASPGAAGTGDLPCASAITVAPLPTWARGGFTPPDQAVPQVRGVTGSILGVVFGDPLRAPDVGGHGNKILWVQSPASGSPAPSADPDLRIHATLNGSDVAIDIVVPGGPGPSIDDVPAPGCWTFNLRWSGRTDRLALRYR